MRIVHIALFLIVLLLSVSCSWQNRLQPDTDQPDTLQGQILLWVELPSTGPDNQSGSIQQVVQTSIKDFNKLYPDVQIFLETFPLRQLQTPLRAQIRRGAGPDLLVVRANTDFINIIKDGLLKTVDDKDIEASQFRTEALKNVRYQNQTYGLPLFLSTQVLCYNKQKIEALPNTLDELIQQARQGYSVGLMSGFVETYWGVGSFGGTSVDTQNNVNAAQWKAWREWMRWLQSAQNEPNLILSDDPSALQQAFLNGQLAYFGCRSDSIPDFSRLLGKETLGVTLLPGTPNQPASPVMETGVIAFSNASSDQQHRLALRFAQFLTNAEQQKRVAAAIPYIPSNKQVVIDPQLFPIRAALLEQSEDALAITLDEMQHTEEVVKEGDILYQRVLAGELSPNAAETQIKMIVQREFNEEE
ncbi:MAG: extracellular solute-binding protein [Cyanobacteria bacterium P01_F01_bin.150]